MSRWEYQVIHLNVEDSSKAAQAPVQQPPTPPAATPSPPPAVAPTETPPIPGQPVFSKAYLEQEFPDFYSNPPSQPHQNQPQSQQQANHPALQLQHFLNGHGQQGWSLVGIYPLGSLLMMFFRRRIAEPSAFTGQGAGQALAGPAVHHQPPAQPPVAQPAPAQTSPDAVSPTEAVGPGSAPSASAGLGHESESAPVADLLQQILKRLESLEGQSQSGPPAQLEQVPSHPAAPSEQAPPASPLVSPSTVTSSALPQRSSVPGERQLRRRSSAATGQPLTSDHTSNSACAPFVSEAPVAVAVSVPAANGLEGRILNEAELISLQGETGLPTIHAAKALKFRSYASLAGFGTRHGYPLGLVKLGSNQMAAVYLGIDQGVRGGRAKRLWAVVPVEQLLALD